MAVVLEAAAEASADLAEVPRVGAEPAEAGNQSTSVRSVVSLLLRGAKGISRFSRSENYDCRAGPDRTSNAIEG